ncbi:MAG: hypothetical protein PHE50_01850 [Dehalococcoidales bacterium]|nr:hypothetical protein [Dehalococcoidales bacterium]
METAIVSLVCVAILLIGTVTTVMTSFNAANKVSDSLKQWEKQSGVINGTGISLLPPANYHSGDVQLTVVNDGKIPLNDFNKWDIIVQWQSNGADQVGYLSRIESGLPAGNQWVVQGIYMSDGTPEVIEPNTLNVSEKMEIIINLSPILHRNDVAMITVSSPGGVTAQTMFKCN